MRRLWGLYEPGDWKTFDFITSDNGAYRFKFSIEGGVGLQGRKATSEQARALADAIYNDLGLGWKKYPENQPEPGWYMVTVQMFGVCQEFRAFYHGSGDWVDNEETPFRYVIAYRSPAPYHPDDKE